VVVAEVKTDPFDLSGWAAVPKSAPTSVGAHADYDAFVQASAKKYDVDPKLIHSIIKHESSGRPDAVSSAGAIGMMQLMPSTAEGLGVKAEDLTDPKTNIDTGTKYFAQLVKNNGGDVDKALRAYNSGHPNSKDPDVMAYSEKIRKDAGVGTDPFDLTGWSAVKAAEPTKQEYKGVPNPPPGTGIEAGVRRGAAGLNPLNLTQMEGVPRAKYDAKAGNAAFEAGLEDASKHPFATAASMIPIVGPSISNFMRRAGGGDVSGALAEAGTTAAGMAAGAKAVEAVNPSSLQEFSNTMNNYRAGSPLTLSSVDLWHPGTWLKPAANAGAYLAEKGASTLAEATNELSKGYVPKNLKKPSGPAAATVESTPAVKATEVNNAAVHHPVDLLKKPAIKTPDITPTPEVGTLAKNTEAVNQPVDVLKTTAEPTNEIESTPALGQIAEREAKTPTTLSEAQQAIKREDALNNRAGLPRKSKESKLPPATELKPRGDTAPDVKNKTVAEVSQMLKDAIEDATEPVPPKASDPFESYYANKKRNPNKTLALNYRAFTKELANRNLTIADLMKLLESEQEK
jgi:hypothetical protein